MMMEVGAFADRLRGLLDERGMKQADLADEPKGEDKKLATEGQVSSWVNGKSVPTLKNALKLAGFFGVRVGWLVAGELPRHDGEEMEAIVRLQWVKDALTRDLDQLTDEDVRDLGDPDGDP